MKSLTSSLLLSIILLAASAMPAAGQEAHFQVFAGRAAPAAQDGDLFSRSYQSGVTFGLGGGLEVSDHLSGEAALSYQRFNLRSPSSVLESHGMDGTGAQYRNPGFHNRFALETSLQYTFRPSSGLQPYVMAGLVQQYVYADALDIRGDVAAMQKSAVRDFTTGVQAGAGLQAYASDGVRLFVEGVYQSHDDGTRTLPVRGGVTIEL